MLPWQEWPGPAAGASSTPISSWSTSATSTEETDPSVSALLVRLRLLAGRPLFAGEEMRVLSTVGGPLVQVTLLQAVAQDSSLPRLGLQQRRTQLGQQRD